MNEYLDPQKAHRVKLIRLLESCHNDALKASFTYAISVFAAIILRTNPMIMAPLAFRFLISRFVYQLLFMVGRNETIVGGGVWSYAMWQILSLFRLGLQNVPPKRKK